MNSRERVLAALEHRVPDRVPLDGWFRPEIVEELEKRLGANWPEELGHDWGGGGSVVLSQPDWDNRTDLKAKPGCWPGAGTKYLWHDERTFEDGWGIVHYVGDNGKYIGWKRGPLSELDPESAEMKTALERLIPKFVPEPAADTAARVAECKRAGKITTGGVSFPFKTAWQTRGMENILCDLLEYPDFAHELFDRLFDFAVQQARLMAAAGTDIICLVGDIASLDRLMFSHEIFNEFLKPGFKRVAQAIRQAAPGKAYLFYHSDGNLDEIMPDLVDEIGVDIVNPVQPESMDCFAVKKRYGDRITIHGTVSVVDLLPKGPVERIRAHVRRLIDGLSYNGGFVLSSANVISFDTPVEHVLAMYEEARNYTSDKWKRPK